ncbi:Sapep family Mn(2+)-dependent dipeptidase [Pantoea sp. BIGb0393]|uniref:Sapep family Mn(2+)-dependent dipeptidase n=1 Tax=Pantoea nemavictus TaxID=2726955 RepID=A0ABU8PYI2_9GAMM|nr:Sapep family Mn(2+)-dependent dipeptidase [Pantoea nemavictus]MBA0038819.1 Sapep family Mn(2+)-dependent dipeptidase [Pantoea nemavictus]
MSASLSPQESALLPQIQQWIAANRAALTADLAEWIAIPSISRADRAAPGAPFGAECAEILQKVLTQAEQAGFKTERHQGYAGSVIYGEHARDIGLINHLDVVPAGDNWTYPPFALTQHGDFVIGRGVADNKGPGVLNFYLLKLIRDLNIPLHHNLRIVYGLAEETNMADMAWFAQHGPVPDYSIVTDGMFPVNNAQKGQLSFTLAVPNAGLLAGIVAGSASNSVPDFASVHIANADLDAVGEKLARLQGLAASYVAIKPQQNGCFTLEARGNGGHAAFPDGTLNATQVLLAALIELELLDDHQRQLAETLVQLFASPYGVGAGLGLEDAESGKLTLNAGVWYSHQADTLSIDGDIRYPVSWRGEQIVEILQQQLAATAITLQPNWRDVAPFFLPASHPVISLLQQVWNDTTGRNDRPYAMGGVTHSKKLPNAITFGPGYRKTAANTPEFLPAGHGLPHGADETIHLPSLLEALPKYVIALIRLDSYLITQ